MKKIAALIVMIYLSLTAASVWAGEFSNLRPLFSAARSSLVTMVFYKDQRGARQQKLVKDTADAVSAKLAQMKAPAGKEGSFRELNENWNAFKYTRENELVPAILKDDSETVARLVWGIQKQRFTKCIALLREIDSQENVSTGNADGYKELGLRLTEARVALLGFMRKGADRGPEAQKLVRDTANSVSVQLENLKAPPGKEAEFKEMVETWQAFKRTRENELVPAIISGNEEEANTIAHGIQKQRLSKVLAFNKEFVSYWKMPSSNAGEIEEFRSRLFVARDSLVEMLKNKDKRGLAQQKLVKETADAVSAHLEKMEIPAAKESQFKELVNTWKAFKDTREKDLVPAILNGKEEEAKIIAFGVQANRLKVCVFLAEQLDN